VALSLLFSRCSAAASSAARARTRGSEGHSECAIESRGTSLYAAPLFGRARIAAAIGRRDEAIELYRAAIAAGLDFTFSPTHEFAPYMQTPAPVALMKSKD